MLKKIIRLINIVFLSLILITCDNSSDESPSGTTNTTNSTNGITVSSVKFTIEDSKGNKETFNYTTEQKAVCQCEQKIVEELETVDSSYIVKIYSHQNSTDITKNCIVITFYGASVQKYNSSQAFITYYDKNGIILNSIFDSSDDAKENFKGDTEVIITNFRNTDESISGSFKGTVYKELENDEKTTYKIQDGQFEIINCEKI